VRTLQRTFLQSERDLAEDGRSINGTTRVAFIVILIAITIFILIGLIPIGVVSERAPSGKGGKPYEAE